MVKSVLNPIEKTAARLTVVRIGALREVPLSAQSVPLRASSVDRCPPRTEHRPSLTAKISSAHHPHAV